MAVPICGLQMAAAAKDEGGDSERLLVGGATVRSSKGGYAWSRKDNDGRRGEAVGASVFGAVAASGDEEGAIGAVRAIGEDNSRGEKEVEGRDCCRGGKATLQRLLMMDAEEEGVGKSQREHNMRRSYILVFQIRMEKMKEVKRPPL
ncbi:hypothetical protein B296_00019827 [Ensete ventricosum]|uniref:DUF834 domain-containing protein n=1 Tax=Ensete ventricosum TaxID=4639 RepID=A0A426ZDJ5_ENSVE|nr:hypothetical protein B296_00019827 [Ensete ventricosum]